MIVNLLTCVKMFNHNAGPVADHYYVNLEDGRTGKPDWCVMSYAHIQDSLNKEGTLETSEWLANMMNASMIIPAYSVSHVLEFLPRVVMHGDVTYMLTIRGTKVGWAASYASDIGSLLPGAHWIQAPKLARAVEGLAAWFFDGLDKNREETKNEVPEETGTNNEPEEQKKEIANEQ